MELKQHIYDEQNGLSYTLVGDYYPPDLVIPKETAQIGKWGRLHRAYLMEYQKFLYEDLVLDARLHAYLAEVDAQAKTRLDTLIAQMKAAEGITEELKANDQMAWVRAMNNIRNRAEEIVLREQIYV